MSVSDLYSTGPKPWCNINVNNINAVSINENPIPPYDFTLNPVNIIYRPGGAVSIGSNIFLTWQDVIDHADQININQIINIYIDDSVVSPAPISVSYDFKNRGTLIASSSKTSETYAKINGGVTISNIRSIIGPNLKILCNSNGSSSLSIEDGSILSLNNSSIACVEESTSPCMEFNAKSCTIILGNNSILDKSLNPSNSIVNMSNTSTLTLVYQDTSSNSNNTINGDETCTLNVMYDTNLDLPYSQVNFVGIINYTKKSKSGSLSYNDTISPAYGSSNVQGALDSIKSGLSVTNNVVVGGKVSVGNGSGGSPSLTFTSDTNTGIYRVEEDTISISCGGGDRLVINSTDAQFNTGLIASSTLDCYSDITAQGSVSSSIIVSAPKCGVDAGTESQPSYVFNNELNTGIYKIGTGEIGISSIGSQVMKVSSTNVLFKQDIVTDVGKSINIARGSNACSGTGAQMSGGVVTVNTTAIGANDIVLLMCTFMGTLPGLGMPVITINPGVSFDITSSDDGDTSTYSWVIIKGS